MAIAGGSTIVWAGDLVTSVGDCGTSVEDFVTSVGDVETSDLVMSDGHLQLEFSRSSRALVGRPIILEEDLA